MALLLKHLLKVTGAYHDSDFKVFDLDQLRMDPTTCQGISKNDLESGEHLEDIVIDVSSYISKDGKPIICFYVKSFEKIKEELMGKSYNGMNDKQYWKITNVSRLLDEIYITLENEHHDFHLTTLDNYQSQIRLTHYE